MIDPVTNSSEFQESITKENKPNYKTHRSGNTFRFTGTKHVHTYPSNIELESNHSNIAFYGEDFVEIPITECDNECHEFKDHIIKYFNEHKHSNHISCKNLSGVTDFCLDKGAAWNIKDILEKYSIKKKITTTLNHYGNIERKITYYLPIIGKLQLKIKNESVKHIYNMDETLFCFKGAFNIADRTMVYRMIGRTFENAFRYSFANIPDGVSSINFDIKCHNSLMGCKPGSAKINSCRIWNKYVNRMVDIDEGYNAYMTIPIYNHFWSPVKSNKKSSIVLDMGRNIKIKYISTMGQPIKTKRYPQRNIDHGFTKKQYDHPIVILDEEIVHAFVKKFMLYGRIDGGKWIFLNKYDANNDRVTEKLIDISRDIPDGFLPRYLKIIPMDYVGSCSMRFMLYGDATDIDVTKNKPIDNVRYIITLPCDEEFSRDGKRSGICRCNYCFGTIENRAKEKRNLISELDNMTQNYNKDPDMFMEEFALGPYVQMSPSDLMLMQEENESSI